MPPDRSFDDSDRERLHLWCAYPEDGLNEAIALAGASLLSEDEHARWQTFRFDRRRREYLTTRLLARIALSHHYSLAPATCAFNRILTASQP